MLLLVAVVAAWTLAAVVTYVDTHQEIDRLLDSHLAQTTSILAAQAGHELLELESHDLLTPGDFGQHVTFQVWSGGTDLLLKSADAPGVRLGTLEEGFADTQIAGRRWRVFTVRDRATQVLIEVAEDHGVRDRIAMRVALNALLPLGAALPVLALLILVSVSRALRPLAALGEQVQSREPLALEALELAHVPTEAVPLVQRLNQLFERIRRTTELERRFTADASHELRKPVAAVRAQAEVARTTRDADTRNGALDKVVSACDRMGVLMDQLLMLARLEADSSARLTTRQDLAGIVRQTMADMAPAGLESGGAEIELEAAGATFVGGQADLLETLVRNLLANAMRHGRSMVRVTVAGVPDGVRLTVADDGPGVPSGDLAQLGERFFRGSAAGPGSGLGLSIVRRIADIHQARLEFRAGAAGQGLEVNVWFPAAAPAAAAPG